MKRIILALSALAALAPLTGASAAPQLSCCRPVPNWYANLSGGAVFLSDTDVSIDSPLSTFRRSDSLTYDVGYNFAGAVGYRVFPFLRVEGELSYRRNLISEVNGAKASASNGRVNSGQRSLAFMGNAYYDWRNKTKLSPYIGAGAGAANVKAGFFYSLRDASGNTVETVTPKDWVFAYQFMAGVSYLTGNETNPFEITLGYRYFATDDVEKSFRLVPGTVKVPNKSNNIELGARLFF